MPDGTPVPYYADESVTLLQGDCLDVLRTLPDASVDAVVTDPPYGLEFMGKEWDGADGFRRSLNANDAGRDNAFGRTSRTSPEYRAGSLFQEWCEAWSTECLRVLKPGGHLLAFGGTRTWHRLACAVEDAGFEVRDSIAWMYGSGFPKSLNLLDESGERTGWGTALKPAFEPIVVARKPLVGTVAANVLAHGTGALNVDGCRVGVSQHERDEIKGREYVAHPSGTYAQDKWTVENLGSGRQPMDYHPQGRWPANVVLDESQAAELDAQSGERPPGGSIVNAGPRANEVYGVDNKPRGDWTAYGDAGGASRFFYVASGAACEFCGEDMTGWHRDARDEHVVAHMPPRRLIIPDPTGKFDDDAGERYKTIPFLYAPKADASERVRINGTAHPTVKPLALMRWLVRLVTPPSGTVLEPFAGSGTTVEACILEGFRCIAIEREAEYLPLIQQRIDRRRDPVAAVLATGDDGGLFDLLEGETA